MLKSVLIANRGEIACRIARTAKRLGLRVIAVYSDVDALAPHVRMADEAVRLGPAPASESYLLGDKVIEAAKATGAEAIHPGYGFLSENADFADSCARAGITFIGSGGSAIRAMGRKDEAKKLMEAAGVPVTPGYHGEDQSEKTLQAEADAIGYPLLIKAVAGGGGKGMRRVDESSQFLDALNAARREAASSFGDERVLLEKFILNPRHIEVQIFGDRRGRVIHLFERDCSVQRRHQKVLEEAPAPGMTPEARAAICSAAVEAGRAVGYENAGTVEFIADGSGELRADGFWFMEMNTRLQVEHPVTELVTGLDLVELQLKIASGGSVPEQDSIHIQGAAMEARLYAEDPSNNFLPSIGGLHRLRLPDHIARVDSGVEEGGEVSLHYDPMIAKIITHGETRSAAVQRLKTAVESVEVLGVKTNAGFLARTLGDDAFAAGGVDTGFLGDRLERLTDTGRITHEAAPLAAALWMDMSEDEAQARAGLAGEPNSPFAVYDGFRMNAASRLQVDFIISGERVSASLLEADDEDETRRIPFDRDGDRFTAMIDGEAVYGRALMSGAELILLLKGEVLRFPAAAAEMDEALEAEGEIVSPMPGKVLDVRVKTGETVIKGQTLVVLEAMKMEQSLTAPRDGVIAEVSVQAGAQVPEGHVLVTLEEEAEAAA